MADSIKRDIDSFLNFTLLKIQEKVYITPINQKGWMLQVNAAIDWEMERFVLILFECSFNDSGGNQ